MLLACGPGTVRTDPPEDRDFRVDVAAVGLFRPSFHGPEVIEVGAHSVSFDVDLWAGDEVTATCMDDDEAVSVTEVIAAGRPLTVHGLLDDHDYRCGVANRALVAETELRTAVEEHPLPDFEVTGDGAALDHGYVLFNVFVDGIDAQEQRVVIVDEEGRLRWSYWIGGDATGDVDTSWPGDGAVLFGGGYGINPTAVNLDGEVVWQAPDAPTDHNYHHHARRQADGTVLAMTLHDDTLDGTDYDGHWIGALNEDGSLAWEWTTAQAVAQGALTPDLDIDDPFHMNSVVPVDFPGCDMLTSMRNADALMCFDHATGEVAWTLQQDFTLVDDDGDPIEDDWPDGQHDPKVEGDHLLVFDNGRDQTDSQRTRIIEYELDPTNFTARKLWNYSEPRWDEGVWGGVERLGDDHVLVAFPHCMDCSSDDTDDIMSALIVLDETHEPAWRLQFAEETVGIYRASRIPACEVFGNARYCEE